MQRSWGGRKFYCSDSCRYKSRVTQHPFVGLDGEGIDDKYILLAASNGKSISRRAGLSTENCLEFLLSLSNPRHRIIRPIYVWFAMDYDVNMMLGGIPLGKRKSYSEPKAGTIAELRYGEKNSIAWRGYRITYLPRKVFRVRDSNGRSFSSYDVWSFFGASFESALREWGLEIPALITEGKASRKEFKSWSIQKLKAYNNAELELLVELAERLRNSVKPLELKPRGWHGPGALANAWLGRNRVKRFYSHQDSEQMNDAINRAYFGGRIESVGIGIIEPVYHYDIVSAYPSAIRTLPNLRKLNWVRHGKPPSSLGGIYCARIGWKIPARYWGVFPWRNKHGTIRYPLEGEGWYWYHEIEAAFRRFPRECFSVKELWQAEGEIEYPLRNLIEETFQYRSELKMRGDPAHFSTKLILNSLYGKFAQSVGRADYRNMIWAGLITSHTRAQLLDVIVDDATVLVMTDSLWSRFPLRKRRLTAGGKSLGEWEQQPETKLALIGAGIYQAWDDQGSTSIWQRGFDRDRPVNVEGLVREWLTGDDMEWPEYKVNRFVGMGLALQTNQPWRHWIECDREIKPVLLSGTAKRFPYYPGNNRILNRRKRRGLVRLDPFDFDDDGARLSYPYSAENEQVSQQEWEDEIEEQ